MIPPEVVSVENTIRAELAPYIPYPARYDKHLGYDDELTNEPPLGILILWLYFKSYSNLDSQKGRLQRQYRSMILVNNVIVT